MDCIGVDLFVVHADGVPPMPKSSGDLELELISNRGTKVPDNGEDPGFLLVDWYRCRYLSKKPIQDDAIMRLMQEVSKNCPWEKAQKLFREGDKDLFSKAHG